MAPVDELPPTSLPTGRGAAEDVCSPVPEVETAVGPVLPELLAQTLRHSDQGLVPEHVYQHFLPGTPEVFGLGPPQFPVLPVSALPPANRGRPEAHVRVLEMAGGGPVPVAPVVRPFTEPRHFLWWWRKKWERGRPGRG